MPSLTDVLRALSSSLQAPVIVLLIALVVVTVVIVGMLIAEVFTERTQFKVSIPHLVEELRSRQDTATVIETSGLLRRQKDILLEILSHPHVEENVRESMTVSLVSGEQSRFDNRVKVTDLIAKIAPMLGLMGTLIPLGPGLIAIGQGDTELLSQSLLIAFDTTVLGLIVAAVALIVSTIRKSWYVKYMAAFESAAECVLEKAKTTSIDRAPEYTDSGNKIKMPGRRGPNPSAASQSSDPALHEQAPAASAQGASAQGGSLFPHEQKSYGMSGAVEAANRTAGSPVPPDAGQGSYDSANPGAAQGQNGWVQR